MQHPATHFNTLQHTAPRKQQVVHQLKMQKKANISLQRTLQRTLQHTATHCNTQTTGGTPAQDAEERKHLTAVHTATHCNTLQHTATRKRQVVHQLKTTGGDCRNLVEKSLSQLFGKLDLTPSFRWVSLCFYSLLQSLFLFLVAVLCSMLQCVQRVCVCTSFRWVGLCFCHLLQCCCSILQCFAVCSESVCMRLLLMGRSLFLSLVAVLLQCFAVCCSVFRECVYAPPFDGSVSVSVTCCSVVAVLCSVLQCVQRVCVCTSFRWVGLCFCHLL